MKTRVTSFPLPTTIGGVTPTCSADGWSSLFVQVEGTFSATYVVEVSIDGKTWFDLGTLIDTRIGTGFGASITAPVLAIAVGPYGPPRYLRAKCTAYTSSDATAFVRFSGLDGR
jgi:hypothetical protein